MSAAAVSEALLALPPQRVLCLCLGNICRSPLAEVIMRRELAARGLAARGWTVLSAGTSGEHEGDGADERSVAVARKNGLDLSKHRAQQLTQQHWKDCTIILAMDSSNHRNAGRVRPSSGSQATLLMYLPQSSKKYAGDVPDPWYGDDSGFDDCFALLTKHVDHVFESILQATQEQAAAGASAKAGAAL